MSHEKSRGHDRTRNWCAVVYPESAPENWQSILDDYHIEWVESPLHEFDANPTGELKKAHYHIVLCFDGPKSYEQVDELIRPLNCPKPIKCNSLKGAVRYMAHLDNPEKFQYHLNDIKAHGGIDLAEVLRPSSSERYGIIREMQRYCRDNKITEFADLFDYAAEEHFEDWFPFLCDNSAYVMSCYLKSYHFRSPAAAESQESEESADSDSNAD